MEAKRSFLRQLNTEIDEIFTEIDSEEESEVRPTANDQEACVSGTNFINISEEEDA